MLPWKNIHTLIIFWGLGLELRWKILKCHSPCVLSMMPVKTFELTCTMRVELWDPRVHSRLNTFIVLHYQYPHIGFRPVSSLVQCSLTHWPVTELNAGGVRLGSRPSFLPSAARLLDDPEDVKSSDKIIKKGDTGVAISSIWKSNTRVRRKKTHTKGEDGFWVGCLHSEAFVFPTAGHSLSVRAPVYCINLHDQETAVKNVCICHESWREAALFLLSPHQRGRASPCLTSRSWRPRPWGCCRCCRWPAACCLLTTPPGTQMTRGHAATWGTCSLEKTWVTSTFAWTKAVLQSTWWCRNQSSSL